MPVTLALSLIVGSLGVSTSPTVEPPIAIEVVSPIVELQKAVNAAEVNKPQNLVLPLISKVARETGVSSTTLYNFAKSESTLNPEAVGDGGCSYGLTQINICAHKSVSKTDALDPEFNLTWAAERIKEGNGWWWTAGNCYSYVLTIVGKLPRMTHILPNSNLGTGTVAIFYYSGVKHIAYVVAVNGRSFTVKEANYKAGLIGTRKVSIDDPSLTGFWSPGE